MMSRVGFPFQQRPKTRQIVGAFGRRNVAYVAFTLLLLVLLLARSIVGPWGTDGVVQAAGVCLLWLAVSGLFSLVSALLILAWIVDQLRGEVPMVATPVSRALIGCGLPGALVLVGVAAVA